MSIRDDIRQILKDHDFGQEYVENRGWRTIPPKAKTELLDVIVDYITARIREVIRNV